MKKIEIFYSTNLLSELENESRSSHNKVSKALSISPLFMIISVVMVTVLIDDDILCSIVLKIGTVLLYSAGNSGIIQQGQ